MSFSRQTLFSTFYFFILLLSYGYTLESARENLLVVPDDRDDDSTNIAFRYIKYLSKNEDEQFAEHSDEDDEESHLHQLDSGSGFDKEEIIEIEINNNNNDDDELILLEDKQPKDAEKKNSIETEVEITSESEEEIEITHEWNGVGKGSGTNDKRALKRNSDDPKSHRKKKSK